MGNLSAQEEQRFLSLSQDIFCLTDAGGRFRIVNPAFERILGYAEEDLLTIPYSDLIHPEDRGKTARAIREANTGGGYVHLENRLRARDGAYRWLRWRIAPIDETGYILATAQDMTDQKQAEEDLVFTQRRLQMASSSSTSTIYEWDLVRGTVTRSMGLSQVLGIYPEEARKNPQWWYDRIHPEDVKNVQAQLDRAKSRLQGFCMEYRILGINGQYVHISDRGIVVPDSSGTARRIVGHAVDVSDQKMAEQALLENQRFLLTLISNLSGVVYRCRLDPDWTMDFISDRCMELTGYLPSDILSGKVSFGRQVIHPEDQQQTWKDISSAVQEGEPFQVTFRIRCADGAEKWAWVQGRAVTGDNGQITGLEGYITDITGQKKGEEDRGRLESQLRQSQKMEAIGLLAGGIAHDFNNLLTAINGYAQLATMNLGKDHPVAKDLEEICNAGERAAALTSQLLAFSRRQVVQPKILDINRVVSNLSKMLRRLIGEDIAFETFLEPDLGRVHADPNQVEQILLNLVVNARDAMPRGGKLEIRTRNEDLDAGFAEEHLNVRPGPYILLAVSDTGIGMNEETRARIFEPFFTTKQGKGTGLGLATVYGIVQQGNGHIWVDSEPGQGTTFRIYLPRVDRQTTEDTARKSAIPRGRETVLVVEDEEVVRNLAVRLLRSYGYDVLEAGSPAEALQLVLSHTGNIQLLISDVIMPGLSGPQLVKQIRASRTAIRVLFISGYTDDAIVKHGVLEAEVDFLQKPFTAEALALKVREVLDSKQG